MVILIATLVSFHFLRRVKGNSNDGQFLSTTSQAEQREHRAALRVRLRLLNSFKNTTLTIITIYDRGKESRLRRSCLIEETVIFGDQAGAALRHRYHCQFLSLW